MCGIAGLVGCADARIGKRMLARVAQRGPDAEDAWLDTEAGIWLGHRRLSILDLSPTGAQPMHSPSGRYVISYNGEIYNHLELRPELEMKGFRFRGSSDTETLLALIEARGLDAALPLLNGMFAFGLWDRQARALYLVRDRFGIKPLVYAPLRKSIAFGSTLWALAELPQLDETIDLAAAADYFRYLTPPAPHTILRGAHKVMPGGVVVWREGKCEERRWWRLDEVIARGREQPLRADTGSLVEALDALIADATRLQRISDVPLGAFLSGGIDSANVVAGMMQSGETRTFTVSFPGSINDESAEAAAVAASLKTIHTVNALTEDEALALVPQLAQIHDEPFADASALPTLLLCRAAREHVTVALSGDGGDEVFGGYPRYFFGAQIERARRWLGHYGSAAVARMMRATPRGFADSVLARAMPGGGGTEGGAARLDRLALYLSTDPADTYRGSLAAWRDPPLLAPEAAMLDTGAVDIRRHSGLSWPEQMMALDQETHLPDDLLTKVDRAAMSVGLEVRVPLLDHRIVEWSWRVPVAQRIGRRGGAGKPLLQGVLARHLPPALTDRPKRGFGAPLDRWLRSRLRGWAKQMLNDRSLAEDGIIDPTRIRQCWQGYIDGVSGVRPVWTALAWLGWREAWREARSPASKVA